MTITNSVTNTTELIEFVKFLRENHVLKETKNADEDACRLLSLVNVFLLNRPKDAAKVNYRNRILDAIAKEIGEDAKTNADDSHRHAYLRTIEIIKDVE
jgi:hypothetical protein